MIMALNANTDLLTQILMVGTKPNNNGKLNSFFGGSYWRRHAMYNKTKAWLKSLFTPSGRKRIRPIVQLPGPESCATD